MTGLKAWVGGAYDKTNGGGVMDGMTDVVSKPIEQVEADMQYGKRYVLGFAFNKTGDLVVLIEKTKPVWQEGLFNGVGGKIELGESVESAMCREFKEEAGVDTKGSDWAYYCRMHSAQFEVYCYSLFSDEVAHSAATKTEERIALMCVSRFLANPGRVVSNLSWLIAAALDRERSKNDFPGMFLDVTYDAPGV